MSPLSTPLSNEAGKSHRRPRDRQISGRIVVIGVLLLGLLTTTLLFIYFEFHTRPFRPLREAIGREFRHSRVLGVEGGKLKGRGPKILRISMSVPFDPSTSRIRQSNMPERSRVLAIAAKYQELASFDQVQINLIYFVPEGEPKLAVVRIWPGAGRRQNAARKNDLQVIPRSSGGARDLDCLSLGRM